MSTAVITGSTKGIGHAMAREFRRHGYDVVVSGRTAEAVAQAVEALQEAPGNGRVTGRATDVAEVDAVQALWDHAVAEHGSVDVWINNAGVAHTTEKVVDTAPADVVTMVRTNMLGTIFGSQVAVRGMTAQGHGKLFNVLGGGSDGRLRPGMGVYSSTKRGLDMLTRALVKETKDTPLLVGQIRPGILISDGWLREAKRAPEQVSSQRTALNILTDHVDDVAPYLVSEVMKATKTGAEVSWLTTSRMARRFMTPGYAKKNDVMGRYGL